jgi:hypothetical protein
MYSWLLLLHKHVKSSKNEWLISILFVGMTTLCAGQSSLKAFTTTSRFKRPVTQASQSLTIRHDRSSNRYSVDMTHVNRNAAPISLTICAGNFNEAINYPVGSSPSSIAVADFNSDGFPDLAVSNFGFIGPIEGISILLGSTTGFISSTLVDAGRNPSYVATGDFNADNRPDLVVSYFNSNMISVLLGNGNGGFGLPINYEVGNHPLFIAVRDINGDQRPDLIVVNIGDFFTNSTVSVLLADARGGFNAAVNYGVGANPRAVAVADFNADNYFDLAVVNEASNTISMLFGTAAGAFSEATDLDYRAATRPTFVTVGNFNGDNQPDLAVVEYGSPGAIALLLNNGSGGFSAGARYGVGTSPGGLAVADINADNTDDLINVNTADNNASVLLSNGVGGFGPITSYRVGNGPGSVTVGDLNGDDRLDLVVANSSNANISVLYNCAGLPANHPPTVANPIPNQTATVGQLVNYSIPVNTFTDSDGDLLTLTVAGLPNGLTFDSNTATIHGTPSTSGVASVTVTATDSGKLSVSSVFVLTINPSSSSFVITGITTVACATVSVSERIVTFTPQYSGLSGQPVSVSVVNEMSPTTSLGPYTLRLYTDNPAITLKATQTSAATEASFVYNWLTECNASTATFAIAGVTTVRCETITTGERQLSFIPQYRGQTSEAISFSVVNELTSTMAPGPYTLRLYVDNPIITLNAQQGTDLASYQYDWIASCVSNGARRKVTEPNNELRIRVLGNPIEHKTAVIEILGITGQPVLLTLTDTQGRVLYQHSIDQATLLERVSVPVGNAPGVLLLQVSTPTQRQQIKLLKP